MWLCKINIHLCIIAKYDELDSERSPIISHQRITLVCLMLIMLSADQTKRRGGETRWWGELHISQLRTMTSVALYRLWSCYNWDVRVMYNTALHRYQYDRICRLTPSVILAINIYITVLIARVHICLNAKYGCVSTAGFLTYFTFLIGSGFFILGQ